MSDAEDQLRALCANHLACGHEVDKEKIEIKYEFDCKSKGCGYYVYMRFTCVEGHHTDWEEIGRSLLPGQYETIDHKRTLR